MANLGSENTPIEGESFGLPSGYSFDEEGGDLVIRDTDGTVVMRRADGAAWQLEGSDISGVGAFDSESVNTEEADIKERDLTLGQNTSTNRDSTTVLGGDAEYNAVSDDSHNEDDAVVIGTDAFADTGWSVTIGANAESRFDETHEGDSTIAIGRNATAEGHSNVVIGQSATAKNQARQTVIGRGATADSARHGISIGYKSLVESSDSMAIGKEAEAASGSFSTVLGPEAMTTGSRSTAIGQDTTADVESVALGSGATATTGSLDRGSIAIGRVAEADGDFSIAIGRSAFTDEDNTMVVALDFDNVLKLDDDGNLEIAGELTENASL